MAEAVRQARARTADVDGVRVEQAALPDAVPVEPVDLAIFSEVLYYLDDATVSATLDRTLAALEPGGDVAVVHWRGGRRRRHATRPPPTEAARPTELTPLVEHVDDGFVLLVLRCR